MSNFAFDFHEWRFAFIIHKNDIKNNTDTAPYTEMPEMSWVYNKQQADQNLFNQTSSHPNITTKLHVIILSDAPQGTRAQQKQQQQQ